MIAGGDEFGRTQQGNNNAYCQDNEISWYDWQWEPWQSDLKVFASQVLRLRRLHSAFRQRYFFDGKPLHAGGPKDLAWLGPDGREIAEAAWHAADSRTLGMFLAGESHGLDDDGRPIRDQSFLVLMHAGATPVVFTLPGLRTDAATACSSTRRRVRPRSPPTSCPPGRRSPCRRAASSPSTRSPRQATPPTPPHSRPVRSRAVHARLCRREGPSSGNGAQR